MVMQMNENLKIIKQKLSKCFDVKYRTLETDLGKCTVVFIDDLVGSSLVSEYVVAPLIEQSYADKDLNYVIESVLDINISDFAKDIDDAIEHILSGDSILIFENYERLIICEVKGYVKRGVSVPETEAVVKGPREGFTESLVDNVSLIRRKIRNTALKFEAYSVGSMSKTKIAITYIEGVAPKYLVNEVKQKILKEDIKFILDTNYIEDVLRGKKSTFDTVGYTEKPDEIASKLMEGRVGVIVDGTPFCITVPYFFLENFQAPDDYYINKYFANFTRVLRWIAFFIATFLPGFYIAVLTYHYALLPTVFLFRLAIARAGVPLPTIVEALLMIFSFQIIKEAGLRLPAPIGGAMSIVSALILGDAVVNAGIASRITIIIIAISSLSYFLIPKIYGALSITSILITIISALFGLPGFFIGAMILLIRLAELRTGGYSYLFPIGSVGTYKFKDVIIRGDLRRISKKIIEEKRGI